MTSHNLRVTDKKVDEHFAALKKSVRTKVSMLSIALDHNSSGIDVSKCFGSVHSLVSAIQLQVKVLPKGAPNSCALMEVDLRIEELHNHINDLSTCLPSQDLLDNLLATLGHVETKVDNVDSHAMKIDTICSHNIKDLTADLKGLNAKVLSCSKMLLATTDVVKDWHDPPQVRCQSPSPDIVEVHAPLTRLHNGTLRMMLQLAPTPAAQAIPLTTRSCLHLLLPQRHPHPLPHLYWHRPLTLLSFTLVP